MLLISYLASPLDVCVYIRVCVCVRACVHPSLYYSTPPLLQSSTRRSAKVSLSTADRGGHMASEQKQKSFINIFFFFFFKCLDAWVKSRARLQTFGMFSKAMHFCVVDKKYILVFKLQQSVRFKVMVNNSPKHWHLLEVIYILVVLGYLNIGGLHLTAFIIVRD